MLWKVEIGSCYGRSFDSNGLLGKFKEWVTKSGSNGGAGWYIIDDQSGAGTDPYIIISDVNALTPNQTSTGRGYNYAPKILKVGYKSSESGKIRIQGVLYWNNTTHTGYGYYGGYRITTQDAADFYYYFHGGDTGIVIVTRYGSTFSAAGIDDMVFNPLWCESTDVCSITTSQVNSGTNVVIQLDTGGASLFSVGKYYYIIDVNNTTAANYFKVVDRDLNNNTITAGTLYNSFGSGSIVCAYQHRFAIIGKDFVNEAKMCYATHHQNETCLPYFSNEGGSAIASQTSAIPPNAYSFYPGFLNTTSGSGKDELDRYFCAVTGVTEWSISIPTYRVYGKFNDILWTTPHDLSTFDTRLVNDVEYIYYMNNIGLGDSNSTIYLYTILRYTQSD